MSGTSATTCTRGYGHTRAATLWRSGRGVGAYHPLPASRKYGAPLVMSASTHGTTSTARDRRARNQTGGAGENVRPAYAPPGALRRRSAVGETGARHSVSLPASLGAVASPATAFPRRRLPRRRPPVSPSLQNGSKSPRVASGSLSADASGRKWGGGTGTSSVAKS